LRAFQFADALAVSVYQHTRTFPREEMFGLTSQMRRAAVAAAANIVEGAARAGEAEYRHFLNQAFGSLREVGYYISLATRLGYLSVEQSSVLDQQYTDAASVLSGLISALRLPANIKPQATGRKPKGEATQ
jgi:four helix bundle protein